MLFDTTDGPSVTVEQSSPKMNCHGPTYETVLCAPTSQKCANDICSTQSSGHCIVVINHEQWKISARLVHLNLLKSSIFQFHFRLTFIVWLMQGILAVTFWHSAMAASGGSKVTYGAMKCALSKARGGRVQFHFCFGVEKSNLKNILHKLIHRFTVDIWQIEKWLFPRKIAVKLLLHNQGQCTKSEMKSSLKWKNQRWKTISFKFGNVTI